VSIRHLILALSLPAAALFAGAASASADTVFARIGTAANSRLSALDDSTPLHVIVTLPLSDASGAAAFAKAVSDPASKLYGHYLTPVEFGARFGSDAGAYEAVRQWGTAHGLTAGRVTNSRSSVTFAGTAGQFASLFSTRFASFPGQTIKGRVMTVAPTLPAELAGKVDGVIGLEDTGRIAMMARPVKTPVANVGTGIGGYSPSDITKAYNIPAQVNPAKTEVLALFEQGGYPASDLTTYLKQYKLPSVPVKLVAVNGSPTGDNGADIEVDLDLDAAIGMNPALSQILVYIDSYQNDSFQTGLLDSLNQIADDNKATVVSISYGQDENQQGQSAIKAEGKAFTQLVAEGIAVFASSGDDGAGGREGGGLNAPDPGSQPELTSVGGTALTVNAATGKWSKEIVWNDGYGATGGGVSEYWTIPSYQVVKGKSVAVANGGSATMRNVPDIASDAAVITPYSVYCASYGGWIGVGGTSFSSPTWASMLSVVNSNRVNLGEARTGFLNPLIYKLGVKGRSFHDITSGNNGTPGYKAGAGYDNDTGFGSINLGKLMGKLTK
jgi:subtilase family serine protease